MQNFKAEVSQQESRTVIRLPFDPNQVWGQKSRHHVRGTINGSMVRGPLVNIGDQYYLNLTPSRLSETGVAVGEMIEVSLEAEGPQLDSLPEDFLSALAAEPQAQAFFESLATFYRTGYLRWLSGASQSEKRAARIQEIVGLLKSGRKQR